jgi:parvulin-like peptidyl-prolyl isomerase
VIKIAASALSLMFMSVGFGAVPAIGEEGPAAVLVEVNGQPITSADLERLIVESHQGGSMTVEEADGLIPKLLHRAIRDELILQDAYSMGLDEEPVVVIPVRQRVVQEAIAVYGQEHVQPRPISDEAVQEFFVDYYHKMQVRQLSLSTPEECEDALQRIKSGKTTMGTLAAQSSLDSRKFRGGLHNDKYWADVEAVIRVASEGVAVGDYSAVFPYNDAFAIIRVESRTPPTQDDLPRFEAYIRGILRAKEQERAWDAMVDECRAGVRVSVDSKAVDAIRADEELLYHGDFKRGSGDPVLWIDERHTLSEAEFRERMSRAAMSMGTSGFEEILELAIEEQRDYLAVWKSATEAGVFERPELVELNEREFRKAVIGYYLDEHVANRVTLDPNEYEQFYRDHQDDFRGPEEVRLSIMTSDDESEMRDAAARLAKGANFDYVRSEVEGRDALPTASPKWTPITSFNQAIVDELAALEVGQSSSPLPYGNKWMIVRLDARREGQVAPIEEVDMVIRNALYQKEFRARVEEHLAKLEEIAEIVRYDDRIMAWAESDS